VLPIYTVEKPGFQQLVHNLARNLVLHGRSFFTKRLETLYNERRLQLIDCLSECTDAASTIDAWTSRRKSYLGETIHWFDRESLTRRSACLAIRRIKGRHTYDVLTTMIADLHKEFEVVDKLRGAATDSGSNFLKAFRARCISCPKLWRKRRCLGTI
jgi:KRAB domain-containing zinc finger protein